MAKSYLSIVIPVFNESQRIKKLKLFIDFIKKQKFKSELIIVNDGSTDNTLKKIGLFKKNYNFKIISYTPNRGKGYALKKGILASNGNYILFSDLDLSTPLTEFQKFRPFLTKFDLIIGTRKIKDSKLIVKQPIIRELMGKTFTNLSNILLQLRVSDFTCGFKCFKKDAAFKIFSQVHINRWGFDSEVLFIAKIKKMKVKEVPVIWKNDSQTKVKFPQDIIYSLIELFKIRINHLLGRYT